MRQVVVRQFAMCQDRVDMRQTSLWTIAHGNGHGTIEIYNRRRLNPYQLVVNRNNLPPVGRPGRFRLRMDGRNRSLQGVSTDAAGAEVTRAELTGEAIRLGRLLTELQPEPEVIGLLSLMLLQESRRAARMSPTGELILLENQDRSLWNREQIAEGLALLERALKSRRFGSYTLQAAIAAVHAEAESMAATDWRRIVALYDRLVRIHPSPVAQLNRAVAIAMCDGPEAGLTHIDALLEHGELANYYLAHSARADLYRRLGRTAEARSSYERALALTQQEPERQFLQERIRQMK